MNYSGSSPIAAYLPFAPYLRGAGTGASVSFSLTAKLHRVAEDLPIDVYEFAVLTVLADKTNEKTGQYNPSYISIASRCHISRNSVARAVSSLRKKGLISTSREEFGQ